MFDKLKLVVTRRKISLWTTSFLTESEHKVLTRKSIASRGRQLLKHLRADKLELVVTVRQTKGLSNTL